MLNHRRYHLDRWIASGGMGEVWQATDTLLDREVALKVLRREYADEALVRARFAAEARHAGALQHPNVASVLDYGEIPVEGQPPLPFLVMELVEGQPLSDLLAGGRALPALVAADYVAQAADGLEAAHAIGIVHRDVKPSNLLVTPQGRVKVTDFGVARAADSAAFTLTGHLIGTPHYLSPEQADGGSATAASDVYALGIVLFECLSGRKPFVGETAVATALMHIRDPLPPLPSAVPERLQRIVQVATAKDPSDRFRSAAAMASALRDDSPDTRAYLLPRASEEPPARRPRIFARVVGAAVAAVLLVAGALWATTAGTSDGPRAPDVVADEGPVLVRVRAEDYVGHPTAEAVTALRELKLEPRVERRDNLGGQPGDTVAAVSPTGRVEEGSTVVLTVWRAPTANTTTSPRHSRGGQAGTGKAGPKHGNATGKGSSANGHGQGIPKHANGKGPGHGKGSGGPGRQGGHGGHAKGGKR